jgi:hypothetical protein
VVEITQTFRVAGTDVDEDVTAQTADTVFATDHYELRYAMEIKLLSRMTVVRRPMAAHPDHSSSAARTTRRRPEPCAPYAAPIASSTGC